MQSLLLQLLWTWQLAPSALPPALLEPANANTTTDARTAERILFIDRTLPDASRVSEPQASCTVSRRVRVGKGPRAKEPEKLTERENPATGPISRNRARLRVTISRKSNPGHLSMNAIPTRITAHRRSQQTRADLETRSRTAPFLPRRAQIERCFAPFRRVVVTVPVRPRKLDAERSDSDVFPGLRRLSIAHNGRAGLGSSPRGAGQPGRSRHSGDRCRERPDAAADSLELRA